MFIKECRWCKKDIIILYKSHLGRKFCSRSCVTLHNLRVKKFISAEKHPLWSGKNVSYNGLHRWLQRNFGKPEKCVDCGKCGELVGNIRKTWNIQWANINQKYDSRDRKDYIGLCAKCHKIFDTAKEKRVHYVNGKTCWVKNFS